MSINVVFDPILGKLRQSDVGVVSLASGASLPDPIIVNNIQVASAASTNLLNANNIYASTISTGNLTTNNLAVTSLASINHINANSILASSISVGTQSLNYQYWNTASASLNSQEGLMHWDSSHGALAYGLPGGNVDLAVGMETVFPRRVKNETGSTLTKGTVVYINGVSGNTPTVTKAIATGDSTSAYTLGLLAEDINNNNTGWVTTFGSITGLNLSSYTGGDTLYLSGVTAGAFTNQIQLAPKHYVRVGTVVKATSDGELVVNVINGFEVQELHNVVITSLASGQILQSGLSNLWYNITPDFIPTASYPSLGSLAVLNDFSYTSLLNRPSLGSLAVLNSLSLDNLTDVALTSVASGQILINNGTNFINTTPLYINFNGKYNTDPSIAGVRDGDQYWNNLDSKMQVYISEWRELNGPERFKFQDDSLFQMQNNAYFQFQD